MCSKDDGLMGQISVFHEPCQCIFFVMHDGALAGRKGISNSVSQNAHERPDRSIRDHFFYPTRDHICLRTRVQIPANRHQIRGRFAGVLTSATYAFDNAVPSKNLSCTTTPCPAGPLPPLWVPHSCRSTAGAMGQCSR